MDQLKRYLLAVLLILFPLIGNGETKDLSPVIVDWIRGRLVISGAASISTREYGNVMEWQLDAAQAAMKELLKNFIRSMQLLRVDAYQSAHAVLKQSYEKNEGIYRYNERIKTYTLKYDDNRVVVTKVYPFYGKDGLVPELIRAGEDVGHFPLYPGYSFTAPFSGLVIDARGLGRVPAFAPRIFDEEHTLVFSADFMEKTSFDRWGAVQYTDDPWYVGFQERVGNNPYRIVAIRNEKLIETDIAVAREDAAVLVQHDETKRNLEEGRVIIILDSGSLFSTYH